MATRMFSADNTEGYTQGQLDELNAAFESELGSLDEDDPDFEEKAAALAEAVEMAYGATPEVEQVSPSSYGVAGWDVQLAVAGDPVEVTLVPSGPDGKPSAWGDLDNWMDSATVERLEPLSDSKDEFLCAVENAASRAILDSGIEPSEDLY